MPQEVKELAKDVHDAPKQSNHIKKSDAFKIARESPKSAPIVYQDCPKSALQRSNSAPRAPSEAI
eukprot:6248865-Pyramimonas_sp.AAC.1